MEIFINQELMTIPGPVSAECPRPGMSINNQGDDDLADELGNGFEEGAAGLH